MSGRLRRDAISQLEDWIKQRNKNIVKPANTIVTTAKVATELVKTGRRIDGEKCNTCGEFAMPKVAEGSMCNARCCSNPECRTVEVKEGKEWKIVKV